MAVSGASRRKQIPAAVKFNLASEAGGVREKFKTAKHDARTLGPVTNGPCDQRPLARRQRHAVRGRASRAVHRTPAWPDPGGHGLGRDDLLHRPARDDRSHREGGSAEGRRRRLLQRPARAAWRGAEGTHPQAHHAAGRHARRRPRRALRAVEAHRKQKRQGWQKIPALRSRQRPRRNEEPRRRATRVVKEIAAALAQVRDDGRSRP